LSCLFEAIALSLPTEKKEVKNHPVPGIDLFVLLCKIWS
jgi:hypothetical protein